MKDNIKDIVGTTLRDFPKTRDDDFILVSTIYGRYVDTSRSFEYIMEHHEELGLPSFESIRRTRQKLQSEFPLLYGASGEMRKMRAEEEKKYRKTFGAGSWM